jgi:hypothetical protein
MQDERWLEDLERLSRRRVKEPAKLFEAIGRLKERYSRVARYYEVT